MGALPELFTKLEEETGAQVSQDAATGTYQVVGNWYQIQSVQEILKHSYRIQCPVERKSAGKAEKEKIKDPRHIPDGAAGTAVSDAAQQHTDTSTKRTSQVPTLTDTPSTCSSKRSTDEGDQYTMGPNMSNKEDCDRANKRNHKMSNEDGLKLPREEQGEKSADIKTDKQEMPFQHVEPGVSNSKTKDADELPEDNSKIESVRRKLSTKVSDSNEQVPSIPNKVHGTYQDRNSNEDTKQTSYGPKKEELKSDPLQLRCNISEYIDKMKPEAKQKIREKYKVVFDYETREEETTLTIKSTYDTKPQDLEQAENDFIALYQKFQMVKSTCVDISLCTLPGDKIREILSGLDEHQRVLVKRDGSTVTLVGMPDDVSKAEREYFHKLNLKRTRDRKQNITDMDGSSASLTQLKTRDEPDKAIHVIDHLEIQVYRGDIVNEKTEGIVNAANGYLSHGAGVAGALSRAAGPTLQAESDAYVAQNGELSVAEVAVTRGGRLHCKVVLHAVGPNWKEYSDHKQCQDDLKSTILNCLMRADTMKLTSLAVPAISSGKFSYNLM